ncbi:hypothetical protein IMZ48_05005 [Candidatus Bathyarchaeota archaeon]|nr:hypothetical protein [Candidatus Bathyarchaeota archaeon]
MNVPFSPYLRFCARRRREGKDGQSEPKERKEAHFQGTFERARGRRVGRGRRVIEPAVEGAAVDAKREVKVAK